MKNARSYSEEADLIKNKIQNLIDQKSKTKKQKDKDAVQAQIEALDEELKMASQFSAEAFAENGEFQKEATALSYQAELMNSLSNDITDPEFTFTEQERDEIQTFINSVGGDINTNENSLAHFSESTETALEINDLETVERMKLYQNLLLTKIMRMRFQMHLALMMLLRRRKRKMKLIKTG